MTTRQVLAIAIKFFSIWFLSQLFIQVPFFIGLLPYTRSDSTGEMSVWAYLLYIVTIIAIGGLLCKFMFKLANSILNSSPDTGNLVVNHDSQQYLLQLGGLYLFITGLLKLIANFFLFIQPTDHISIPEYTLRNALTLSGLFLNCAIGLWLIVYPGWWSHLLKKLRSKP